MTQRRPPPPTPPPADDDPNINLRGHFDTRMTNGRRKRFNGVLRHAPLFDEIIQVVSNGGVRTNEAVKGLFVAAPFLIHASPQQVLMEVTLQSVSARNLAAVGNTTLDGVRAILRELIKRMDLFAFSQALSRMKQHDRDLAEHPATRGEIARWRSIHGSMGDPDARTATRIRSSWVNFADGALINISKANALKRRHPSILSRAPMLKLCTDVKGKDKCKEIDRTIVESIFTDVK
jgi:hypothetical protein